jgi:hypothetical protein
MARAREAFIQWAEGVALVDLDSQSSKRVLSGDPQVVVSLTGSTLVAVGLLAHTVWDPIHLRARAIVSPSLAEWCAVLDTLIAVGILVLVWR